MRWFHFLLIFCVGLAQGPSAQASWISRIWGTIGGSVSRVLFLEEDEPTALCPTYFDYDQLVGLPDTLIAGYQSYQIFTQDQGQQELVGWVDAGITHQTLRFDIEIEPVHRGQGLYAKILKEILNRAPQVTRIPAQFPSKSDNQKIFVQHAFQGRYDFIGLGIENLEKWSSDEVLQIRGKFLDAMELMPAYKARDRVGFSRVTKLVIDPVHECIDFAVERGVALPGDQIKILVVQGAGEDWELDALELKPDGSVERKASTAASVGSDYFRPAISPCLSF